MAPAQAYAPEESLLSEKQFITAQDLLEDSFRLGLSILDSGFRPDFIVGIWRGGTPVGVAIQELLDYFGVETDHIAIRTSLYTGIGQRARKVRVHGLNYVVQQVNAEDSLLIVDDVYDTGLSIQAVVRELEQKCRKNTPHEVRIATTYYKPANNKTDREPEFYVHETDRWLVFPHELHGLSIEEIRDCKLGTAEVVREVNRRAARTC